MPPRPQRCGSPALWGPVPCWRGARAWRGLVRAAGVEPAWAKARAILSRQCLPFHHARYSRRANLRPKRGFRRGDASADRPIWQCRGGAFMRAWLRPEQGEMAKRLGESGTRPVCRPPSKKARPDGARLQVFALAAAIRRWRSRSRSTPPDPWSSTGRSSSCRCP